MRVEGDGTHDDGIDLSRPASFLERPLDRLLEEAVRAMTDMRGERERLRESRCPQFPISRSEKQLPMTRGNPFHCLVLQPFPVN
ncbi:hypothetical protein GCM10027040_29960 [Halomonas shantousis]